MHDGVEYDWPCLAVNPLSEDNVVFALIEWGKFTPVHPQSFMVAFFARLGPSGPNPTQPRIYTLNKGLRIFQRVLFTADDHL